MAWEGEEEALAKCTLTRSERQQQLEILNGFLTQRALQTLIFYQKTGRDTVTADWLEKFLGHEGIARFHGTRGLKVKWQEYVTALFTADVEEIVVSLKRRGNGVGGWSRHNPYLQDRYFNYSVEIYPRDLGERLLEIRLALADEWRADLPRVAVTHAEHWRWRRAEIRHGTQVAEEDKKLRYPALEGYDASIGAGDSTAFRAGNFDLLGRLSAHQAILLTLKKLDANGGRHARYTRRFLADFFERRKDGAFDGDGPSRVAEDFFADLAAQVPRILDDDDVKSPLLLDPVAICETIMAQQRQVIALWRWALRSVATDNANVRRLALERSFKVLRD